MLCTELIDLPEDGKPFATLLLAHGAGAPMDSPFMQRLSAELSALGLRVIRFEFPYMQDRRLSGRKRPPDPMPRLLECFRAQHANALANKVGPVFLGGKSMGGRVASMLADELPVSGVACFGYPFHPPGKPDKTRTAHLQQLTTPVLILQGTRDPLGRPAEVAGYLLSQPLQVQWLESGDHDFKPLKASGRTQAEVVKEAAKATAVFCRERLAG
ncbi:alpha/beta fold hydrolase [Halopseudomonas pelagia]|uniref:alpha/beta fold hydrolase n=1 Tax=Halopseudomonas pelagia TaxID=553151 RepID=UPI0003A85E81|nr:alpha/beta fold hydrolase [Halopseudomonas pelagia]